MKNNVKNVFGKKQAKNIETLIDFYDFKNLPIDMVVKSLYNFDEKTRNEIYVYSLLIGNEVLFKKISEAKKIIEQSQVRAFKKAYLNKDSDNYLLTLSFNEINLLMINLGINIHSKLEYKALSDLNKSYYDTINTFFSKSQEYIYSSEEMDVFDDSFELRTNKIKKIEQ